MNEPHRRRRRPPLACTLCRSRKIRCDRKSPCGNCLRARNGTCVYENHGHPSQSTHQHLNYGNQTALGVAQGPTETQYTTPATSVSTESIIPSHPQSTLAASSTNASTLASQSSARDIKFLERRVQQLEEQLSKAAQRPAQSPLQTWGPDIEIKTSHLGETFSMYKTRMYGQSHWFNGVALFQDLFNGIEPHFQEETSKAFLGFQRCKSLAKIVKSQRAPLWPSLLQANLPSKDVADELVDCYFRTTESVYRILHEPSFRKDYDALWITETEHNTSFLIQLKLILAIGAVTYDENFSLRSSAVHWVYESHNWLSRPQFKSHLNIQSLQINILLLIAREVTNVSGELVWISAGALLRTAVYMGLHKDPAHMSQKTTFAVEMRRRLWNTILEINLQFSMVSGGPAFVSLDDFDTEPPRNLDDDQLVTDDTLPKPEDHFTQMSIAIALRRSFSSRLAITKFLNDLGPRSTYEEALRLDANLRTAYKALRRTFQAHNSNTKPSSYQFEIRVVDLLMNYYLLSLHIPFLGPALHDTTYAFSRKVVLETALKVWCAAHPPPFTTADTSGSDVLNRDDLARLTTCGSGFFRTVTFQASMLIVVELKTQIQEEESMGPVPLRPDLVSVLDDAKSWSLRCLVAGETNTKTYLLMSIVSAQIKGLMQGLGKDALSELLLEAARGAEEVCLPVLKDHAAQGQDGGTAGGIDQMSLNEQIEDWDFMTSDALFNFGDGEPMNWLFNNATTQEPPL